MRGEDSPRSVSVCALLETPPHAWGRRRPRRYRTTCGRNTPTCVGKTPRSANARDRRRKHPHMRGEDPVRLEYSSSPAETPPHAWGRHSFVSRLDAAGRNTPTCVGKTGWWWRRACPCRKHPHMRGEDSPLFQAYAVVPETPPHAWGRHEFMIVGAAMRRNTPTCVGKTAISILIQ